MSDDRRKKYSTRGKVRMQKHRGRPSQVDIDRLFSRDGQLIAAKFKLDPLRQPIGPQFQPYYERFLRGHLTALVDYCLRAKNLRHDGSFYELIGRLFFFRHHRAVKRILLEIDRATGINDRETYTYWYELLLPLCQRARQFIRENHDSCPNAKLSRDTLARKYIAQKPTLSEAIQEWPEPYKSQFEMPRQLRDRWQAESMPLTESNLLLKSVKEFSRWGFVTREIFWSLASTQPTLTPATIARRYACKIADVSESWASRKTVRT